MAFEFGFLSHISLTSFFWFIYLLVFNTVPKKQQTQSINSIEILTYLYVFLNLVDNKFFTFDFKVLITIETLMCLYLFGLPIPSLSLP